MWTELLLILIWMFAVVFGALACGFIAGILLASLCKAVFPNNTTIPVAGLYVGAISGALFWVWITLW